MLYNKPVKKVALYCTASENYQIVLCRWPGLEEEGPV